MDDIKLNVDILHRVMASSSQDTVSRVMRTCRTLNHEGARYLLRQDPHLTSAEEATSFLLFLHARGKVTTTAYRLHWLEGLDISSYYDPDESKEEAFASVLKAFFIHCAPLARRFLRLNINQDEGESLFNADPELALAISKLDTLHILTLTQAADHTMAMLRGLQSRLCHVDITFDPESFQDSVEDPVAALESSQTSLRTLSVGWAAVAVSPSPPRFLYLHKLSLSYVALPTTWHLVQAFPNLSIISTSDIALRVHSGGDEARMRQRLVNIRDQQQYGSWASLRSFKGSLSMLFVLGLTCHVPRVDVGNDIDPDESFDLEMLHAVFMDTRPTQLTLHIRCPSHVPVPDFADSLLSLCSRREFKNVETCEVRLTMFPGDRDYEVEAFLDALCEAMGVTQLDALELRIDWSYLARPPFRIPRRPKTEPQPPSPALAQLESLEAESLAERLLDDVPSIRTAKVSLIGPTNRDIVELERSSCDCSSESDDSCDCSSDQDDGRFDSGEDADVSADSDELAFD